MIDFIKKVVSNKNKTNNKTKRKNNFKKMISDNIKKGKEYERFIGKLFEEKGYIVKYNGIEQGKKDNSIDIIAIKQNEIILTQCKNWKKDSKYKINHEKIKAFIGDTYSFIENNPVYKNYKIKRLFCVANNVFDKSAIKYLEENKNFLKYRIIEYKKDNRN